MTAAGRKVLVPGRPFLKLLLRYRWAGQR